MYITPSSTQGNFVFENKKMEEGCTIENNTLIHENNFYLAYANMTEI